MNSWRPTIRRSVTAQAGGIRHRATEAMLPTLRVVPNAHVARFALAESIDWMRPIDNMSFRTYVAGQVEQAGDIGCTRSKFAGKFWWDVMREERFALSGDDEAEVGQGAIMRHAKEHLASSDSSIAMLRRLLQRQVHVVAEGGDPADGSFDRDAAPIVFEIGKHLRNE
jgi:hypothetical protein